MKTKTSMPAVIIFQVFLTFSIVYSQPAVDGYNVYYGSLHNHTNVSDGQGTPDQAYNYAKNTAQLDFFGLSEHANMMSSSEWTTIKNTANAYNQDGVFAAFYGFEWTTFFSYGHVTVVNTSDFCSNSSPTNNFNGLLYWLSTRNGIAFFNHPGWEAWAYTEFDHFTDTPSDKFVGMELWNDHDGFSKYYYNDGYYSGDGNKGYFDEALIRHWKIGAAGGDDNHTATWGTATPMQMGVLAKAKTRTEILDAIMARRCFSTVDRNLVLSFKVNGYEMGSTIEGGKWNIAVQAFDGDNEFFTNADLLKNGAVIQSWTLNHQHPFIASPVTCADGDYFYVRVKEADGDEAISSPIFISGTANQPPQVAITSPVNGDSFTAGSDISLIAYATDPDGTVSNVSFYMDDQFLGQDNASPFSITWADIPGGTCSLRAVATDNIGLTAESSCVTITINPKIISHSLKIPLIAGTDDAEEKTTGNMITGSNDLDLAFDDSIPGNQIVGLRFRDLSIPKNAIIKKAFIHFTAEMAGSDYCSLQITGEASGNPPGFSSGPNNISLRQHTSMSIPWYPGNWEKQGDCLDNQQTPDLTGIINELMGLSKSVIVDNIVFIISGEGSRTAVSFEGDPALAPVLFIEYKAEAIPIKPHFKNRDDELAMNKTEPLNKLILYPNPANEYTNVSFERPEEIRGIYICNSSGKQIEAATDYLNADKIKIECNGYASGLYFIRIITRDGIYVAKLLKN